MCPVVAYVSHQKLPFWGILMASVDPLSQKGNFASPDNKNIM
jgi:hypothetical protein